MNSKVGTNKWFLTALVIVFVSYCHYDCIEGLVVRLPQPLNGSLGIRTTATSSSLLLDRSGQQQQQQQWDNSDVDNEHASQQVQQTQQQCRVSPTANNLYSENSRRGFFRNVIQKSFLVSSAVLVAATSSSSSEAQAAVGTATTTIIPPPVVTAPILNSNANFDQIQFETAGMVPRIYFEEKRSIYGFVERVLDGDTIRVTHVPNYGVDKKIPTPIQKRGIADVTISVRLYGIDAPEISKNKNQTSQPFGDDSKQYTSDTVFHKMVKITFLQKDKYGRVVGAVETVDKNLDLSIELAKRGYAELYTGGGAQYWTPTKQQQLNEAIADAKKNKRGIWSLGDAYVSAAEQKRILRNGSD